MALRWMKTQRIFVKYILEEGGLETLSIERIYTEYSKILMGLYPSQGFNFLRDIHGLPLYLEDLVTTHQRTDYHPEGMYRIIQCW